MTNNDDDQNESQNRKQEDEQANVEHIKQGALISQLQIGSEDVP